ncbi:hypothetical protein [Nocardia brasiliensis]|uniref:hypothetical protein n=1 Tax=Nocardia brasiliensis TaxID=37326 RepID=UPI0024581BA7|nr:hypothetical protein [Nocardia brasiliensis]
MLSIRGITCCVVVIAMLIGACDAVRTPRGAARHAQSEIAKMPGVEDVSINYSDGFAHANALRIELDLTKTSEPAIATVARRLNELLPAHGEAVDRTIVVAVGHRLFAERGPDLDPEQIADDTSRLRRIGVLLPEATVRWTRRASLSSVRLDGIHSPGAALAAARQGFEDQPVSVVIAAADRDLPRWEVSLPFTVEQEAAVEQLLGLLDLVVRWVTVRAGRITTLSVAVRNSDTAYADLVDTIVALQPTRENPVLLHWSLVGDPGRERKFAGSVHIGGCAYGDSREGGELTPEKFYSVEAIAVRKRLRTEFDMCPR